eukprot:1390046-Amphidinium_carterae.2
MTQCFDHESYPCMAQMIALYLFKWERPQPATIKCWLMSRTWQVCSGPVFKEQLLLSRQPPLGQ